MRIPSLSSFATSKTGQSFYKWICDPKKEKFLNNTLPTIETLVVSAAYVYFTEKQENIPRDQRTLLQWQNVLGCVFGMALGSFFNRKVSNYAEKLAPLIDKNLVDVHKVSAGLRIALPIVATACVMRIGVPIVSTQISTEIEKRRRANRDKGINKLA